LDFVAAMERCSVREAALKLQAWFGTRPWPPPADLGRQNTELVRKKEGGNQPLPFLLSPVDPCHPYLAARGIRPRTAADFGVGFFAGGGLMSGRVVFPIHDEQARLVAYAGRSTDGALPRYRLPAGFHKSLVLYNLHRAVASGQDTVIMVEGFLDCLKVHQAGLPCVIALLGSVLTEGQRELLLPRFRRVVLMLDGDQTGRAASVTIRARLAGDCAVRVVELPAGEQPDRLPAPVLCQLVSSVMFQT
jgi:DNA primase